MFDRLRSLAYGKTPKSTAPSRRDTSEQGGPAATGPPSSTQTQAVTFSASSGESSAAPASPAADSPVSSDYIARGGPDSNGFASAESLQRGRSPAASLPSERHGELPVQYHEYFQPPMIGFVAGSIVGEMSGKLTTPEKKPFGDKVRLKPGEVGW